MMPGMLTAYRAVLLATLLAVPVTMAPGGTWDAFNLPKLAVLLIGVATAASLRLLRGAPVLPGSRRVLVPIALLGTPLLLSWLASPYRAWSFLGQYTSYQGLLPYAAVMLLAFLVADAFGGRGPQVARVLTAGAAVVATYAIAQSLGFDPIDWSMYGGLLEGGSTLGNPNFSASFLAIGVPLSLGTTLERRTITSWALVALVCGGLVAARSEGATAAAVAGVAVTLGWQARRGNAAKALAAIVAALCAFAIVAAVGAAAVSSGVADRSLSLRDRSYYWIAAGGALAEDPFLGRGPDSFALEGVRHRVPEEGVERAFAFTFDPHSAPLMLGSSNGLLALAGFIGVALWVFRKGSRAALASPTGAAFFGAAVAYLVQSLWATEQLAVRTVFWATVGMIAVGLEARPGPSASESERRLHPWRAAAAIASLVPALWLAGRLVLSDHSALQGVRALGAGKRLEAAGHLTRAVGRAGLVQHRKMLGDVYVSLGVSGELPAEDALRGVEGAYGFTHDVPDVDALAAYGNALLLLSGDQDEVAESALARYETAVALDPTNPLLRVGASDALLRLDRPDEAHDVLEPLFFFFPPQREFWGALALANVMSGDLQPARSYLDYATGLGPLDVRGEQARVALERLGG